MVCEFPILFRGREPNSLSRSVTAAGRMPGSGCWTLMNLITPGAISGWNFCTGPVV
jgi:hypothetical protein